MNRMIRHDAVFDKAIPPSNEPPHDVAGDNLNFDWANIIARVGFEIVAVQVNKCDALWKQTTFAEDLGKQLEASELGHLDSTAWEPEIVAFYYIRSKRFLPGLEMIRNDLRRRGLEPHAHLAATDAAQAVWRNLTPGK